MASAANARIAELRSSKRPATRKAPRAAAHAEHVPIEQLDLDFFGGADRLPRRPWCSRDLEYGVQVRSLAQALTRPYVQINRPHLRVWSIFDIDRPGAAVAWEDAGLPPPSWAAVNRENGHAHLVWGLSAPVLVDSPDMRQAPMRYLAAVESLMREKLQADPGFSGLITKNPIHPLWHTLRGPRLGYELAELAKYLPDLEKHTPKRRKPEEVGLGRNVTLFDWLRQYAYRHIRHYKGDVRNFVLWQSHLNVKALERNSEFPHPLDPRECWHIAKSVSKWTWNRFDLVASDARFSGLQAHRGRASGEARLAKNEDKRSSARLMRSTGMSTRTIAAELGVDQSTVVRWLG